MTLNNESIDDGGRSSPPIFNAPRSVVWLIGLIVVIHISRALIPVDWDELVIFYFAFFPGKYAGDVSISFVEKIVAFVSHMFLHGDFRHVGFNAIWLLALGTPVARRLSAKRFFSLFLICGVLGALSHLMLIPLSGSPMVGASGAIAGMMGAAVRFALYVPGGYARSMREGFGGGLIAPLTDRRVLIFSGLWIALNIVLGLSGGPMSSAGQSIAWDVHIAGYFAGLFLFPLFDRGSGGAGNGSNGDRGSRRDIPYLRRVK